MKNVKDQKMVSWINEPRKYEGSSQVQLTAAELVELMNNKVLQKPRNQREVKRSHVTKNGKMFFAWMLYISDRHGKTITPKCKTFSQLRIAGKAADNNITITARRVKSKWVFEYQDGQHRLIYLSEIFKNNIPLVLNLDAPKPIKEMIREIFIAATSQGIDTSKGIYFCMLPDFIQEKIRNATFNVITYYVDDELDGRAIFDYKNRNVNMTNPDRQNNLHVGEPMYDLITMVSKACDKNDKDHFKDFPSFMKQRDITLFLQLTNGKKKGVGINIKPVKIKDLIYRCIMTSLVSLNEVSNNQSIWKSKSADALANDFLNKYANLTEDEAIKLLNKAFENMYKASILLNDVKEDNSTFAQYQALLPATIIAYRRLLEISKKNTYYKTRIMNVFKDETNRKKLLEMCEHDPKRTRQSLQSGNNAYSVYADILLKVDKRLEILNMEV